MVIEVPESALSGVRMTAEDLKLEPAISLFQQETLSLGKAGELAGMSRIAFQKELARRKIPLHYDVEDLRQDVAGLKAAGLL